MENGMVRVGIMGSGRAVMIQPNNFATSVKHVKVVSLSDSCEDYHSFNLFN